MSEQEKVYSADEEHYFEYEDVLNTLENNGDLMPGAVICEGESVRRTAGEYLDENAISALLDSLGEVAFDDVDEVVGDRPMNELSLEKQKELQTLIAGWLNANLPVHFFAVANVKKITLTEEMIAEFRA